MSTSNQQVKRAIGWMRRRAAAWQRDVEAQRRSHTAAPDTQQQQQPQDDDATYWRNVYALTSLHY